VTEARRKRVAIVEDDDGVRDSLQFLLEIAGHVVEAFASAATFLKADIDEMACVIADHHMPHMTGLDLVERLRANGIGIPVLLVTGALSPAIVARATELGVERVLEKPPDEQALLDFINSKMS
jgi:two-component system, LuxR family, response regulator FixJ